MTRETLELQPRDDAVEAVPMDMGSSHLIDVSNFTGGTIPQAPHGGRRDPVAGLKSYLDKINR
jgi:hypothetical protein